MIKTYGRIREFILGIITNKNYKNMNYNNKNEYG